MSDDLEQVEQEQDESGYEPDDTKKGKPLPSFTDEYGNKMEGNVLFGAEMLEEPKLNKLADLVDELVAEMKHQAEHNSPITPNMINKLEAIQTLIYQPD